MDERLRPITASGAGKRRAELGYRLEMCRRGWFLGRTVFTYIGSGANVSKAGENPMATPASAGHARQDDAERHVRA